MKRFTPFQWAAVLTLALALAPPAASAQEEGTVKVSGVFSMDYVYGENDLYFVAPELLAVYNNGYEHTWTLTLHGTYQSHYTNGFYYATDIQATSFDLEFFGPDAATLNGFVSDNLAGAEVSVYLQNNYVDGGGIAIMHIWISGGVNGTYFYSGHDMGAFTLFPTDADGYPVLGPEPFSIQPDYTQLGFSDPFSGTYGAIESLAGLVTFEGDGSVGDPPPPPSLPTLAIEDGSVLEGNRGTTDLNLTVTLSASSTSTVTVNYATANGTAIAKSDYNATSGTLTFQPGQTSKTISVAIKGDRKSEADETLLVQLSDAVGATIGDGAATVTILNDD